MDNSEQSNKPIGNLPERRAPKLVMNERGNEQDRRQRGPDITESNEPAKRHSHRRRSGKSESDFEASSRHSTSRHSSHRSRSSKRSGSPMGRLALATGFLMLSAVLIIASYLFGQQQGEKEASQKAVQKAVNSQPVETVQKSLANTSKKDATSSSQERKQILDILDASFQALSSHDPEKAFNEASKIKEMAPEFPGLEYHLARIQQSLGKSLEATTSADASIARGEEVSDAYILKGQILLQQRVFDSTYAAFESATAVDPYRPYAYFYWGEALRIEGKSQQGIKRLEQALNRASEQPDAFVIRLKLLLAKVEADDTDFVDSELKPALEKENPAGEYLMAAAALAMKDNRTDEAVGYLKRAQSALQPAFYWFLAADNFFDLYRSNAQLAPYIDTSH